MITRLSISASLVLSAAVLVASPALAAIDMYVDTENGLQYHNTYETEYEALEAAEDMRQQGAIVVCEWDGNGIIAACPRPEVAGGSGRDNLPGDGLPTLPIIFVFQPIDGAATA